MIHGTIYPIHYNLFWVKKLSQILCCKKSISNVGSKVLYSRASLNRRFSRKDKQRVRAAVNQCHLEPITLCTSDKPTPCTCNWKVTLRFPEDHHPNTFADLVAASLSACLGSLIPYITSSIACLI